MRQTSNNRKTSNSRVLILDGPRKGQTGRIIGVGERFCDELGLVRTVTVEFADWQTIKFDESSTEFVRDE